MELRTGTIGGVLALALAWAVVWAFPGGVIEAVDNVAPAAHGFTRRVDMWMQTLAIPGFIGGLIFSVVLRFTGPGRRLTELSPTRSAASGAVAGLLTGAVVVWLLYSGLSRSWAAAATAIALATVLGLVAGLASPLLLRVVASRRPFTRA